MAFHRSAPAFSGPELDSYTAFPNNANPQHAFRATIQQIDDIVQDVEMQAPFSEGSTYLVVDTNILLGHLDVMKQFVEEAESHSLPVLVVIPGVVIYELDSQKNRGGLAWFARRASAWLLKKVKERKIIKGQANEETCKKSGNWKIREPGEEKERKNDDLILDCCLYFREKNRTFLCSADKNLCFDSESASTGIHTISPKEKWSCQDIVWELWKAYNIDVSSFGKYRASYKDPKSHRSNRLTVTMSEDDDMMEVDDEGSGKPEVLLPSHALDLLHLQIIEHFTNLLVELVGRVGGEEIRSGNASEDGTLSSRHAPPWKSLTRPYLEWTARELLEYLDDKKKMTSRGPSIEVFLSQPYHSQGARRGQDWSRRDWDIALGSLEELGRTWRELTIGDSVQVLRGHVENVFALKLRPTGNY